MIRTFIKIIKIINDCCPLKYSRSTFRLTVQQHEVAIITDSAIERERRVKVTQTKVEPGWLTYRIGFAELASFILLSLQEEQKMLPQFLQ